MIIIKEEEALDQDKWFKEIGNALIAEKKSLNFLSLHEKKQTVSQRYTAEIAGQKTNHHEDFNQ